MLPSDFDNDDDDDDDCPDADELERREIIRQYEEFWSDPCWTEPIVSK